MINFKNETQNNIWWIVKSGDDSIIHHGMLEPGMVLESGQIKFDTYLSEQEWVTALSLLNVIIE